MPALPRHICIANCECDFSLTTAETSPGVHTTLEVVALTNFTKVHWSRNLHSLKREVPYQNSTSQQERHTFGYLKLMSHCTLAFLPAFVKLHWIRETKIALFSDIYCCLYFFCKPHIAPHTLCKSLKWWRWTGRNMLEWWSDMDSKFITLHVTSGVNTYCASLCLYTMHSEGEMDVCVGPEQGWIVYFHSPISWRTSEYEFKLKREILLYIGGLCSPAHTPSGSSSLSAIKCPLKWLVRTVYTYIVVLLVLGGIYVVAGAVGKLAERHDTFG